jgi:ribosome biogenesis GTPase / thiamine phosphate phosphatase
MRNIDIDALEDEWDEDEPPRPSRARNLSPAAQQRIEDLGSARVVTIDRGRITVLYEGAIVEATLAGTMRGAKAAVGDRVRVRPPRHEQDRPRIVDVLPRDTVLLRTGDDAVDESRVVVANADQVVVVVAADHLVAGAGLLDRVMVAASAGALDTAVCVNKVDLVAHEPGGADRTAALLERYRGLGVEGCATSAVTGAGIDALGELLRGRWSAFTGHSGVGKSSLFNLLVPDADHAIGEMGRYGGRHTTVSSRAMRVEELDAWLVDTPGIRSFGLGVVEPRELARHFPELAELVCDLDDCIHEGEPGCALDEAAVHPARLASYRRLLAALRDRDRGE